jgi:ABC-type nitrate/sulfonate/bicarbonate transport system substrate-binding protein
VRRHRIDLSYFSRSVVTEVAEREGIFARHGVEVHTTAVTSSSHQFRLLVDGGCDLALTSPDNVAAYRGSDRNPLGRQLDVRILVAVDGGLGLSVMAQPSIRDLSELRGRVIGVDVAESGFAIALFGLLAAAGLEAGDYEIATLGSTPQRRAALLEGACDATLLNAGHDIAAELAGCRRLAQVTDRYHPYLGAVLAGTGAWLEDHEADGRRFVAAWTEAVRGVLDPRRMAAMIAVTEEVLELSGPAAERFYRVLTSERDGLVAEGVVDPAALQTVLDLRAGPGGPPPTCAGLVDSRFLVG